MFNMLDNNTTDLYHNSLADNNPLFETLRGKTELKNNVSALIDKMCIYGIEVKNIKEIQGLIDLNIVTIKEGKRNYLFNENDERYSLIRITGTDLFDSFEYGVTKGGKIRSVLQVSVNDPKYKNLNCYTAEDYKARIMKIKELLIDKYGIEINIDHAKIACMEINKTIVLNTYYENYIRILERLCSLFPGKLRFRNNPYCNNYIPGRRPTDIKRIQETFIRNSGKKGIAIEIYNKKKEMKEVYKIDLMNNYLRFEIKLKSGTKIKKELGSNVFWDLDDEDINEWFTNFIINNVETPYNDYCNDRDKRIVKILKETYTPYSKTWTRDSILKICNKEMKEDIPFMININETVDLLDGLPFLSRQCKYNAKRSFQAVANKYIDEYTKYDSEAYLELIKKLK